MSTLREQKTAFDAIVKMVSEVLALAQDNLKHANKNTGCNGSIRRCINKTTAGLLTKRN